jgi:hypothetical protein
LTVSPFDGSFARLGITSLKEEETKNQSCSSSFNLRIIISVTAHLDHHSTALASFLMCSHFFPFLKVAAYVVVAFIFCQFSQYAPTPSPLRFSKGRVVDF